MGVNYPLAKNAVFSTVQGEGALSGLPMIFVRLGGCSVGCDHCDTDYRVVERVTAEELQNRVSQFLHGGVEWAWITGGEPTDHDISPLVDGLRSLGLRVALATAGTRAVQRGFVWGGVDFLSVSPHSRQGWVQRSGDQLNVVPGLNGLSLSDIGGELDSCAKDFTHCYVTPLAGHDGRPENLQECLGWVRSRRRWRLGHQAHKTWKLP